MNAAALWKQIASRTDEIYVVGETLLPIFRETMAGLVAEAGLPPTALDLGPLKDPVRVSEKAAESYGDRFDDGVLCEACVTDMLRCRGLCESGLAMLKLLMLLAQEGGFDYTTKNGGNAHVSLLRSKNKFGSKDIGPTHFRNVLNNLELSFNGSSMFVEMQIHHVDIMQVTEKSRFLYSFRIYKFPHISILLIC